MKNRINYEDFLFSSFINSNFQRFCITRMVMQNQTIVDIDEFYKNLNLNTVYSVLTAEISELLFSIIWLKEEDKKLTNIKPSCLGIVDKYGCDDAQDFLRHLRNSIAHKRCIFYDDGSAEFSDSKSGKENFHIDLDKPQFDELKEEFRNLAVREFFPKTVRSQIVTNARIGGNCYLGDYAFCGNINLQTITIPQHISEIPQWSFCNCQNLRFIGLPEKVKYIRKRAFSGCEGLKILSYNYNTLEQIGDYAFADCCAIDSIYISAKAHLGRRVFSGWTSSQTINICGTSAAPHDWSKDWNENCLATINYIDC